MDMVEPHIQRHPYTILPLFAGPVRVPDPTMERVLTGWNDDKDEPLSDAEYLQLVHDSEEDYPALIANVRRGFAAVLLAHSLLHRSKLASSCRLASLNGTEQVIGKRKYSGSGLMYALLEGGAMPAYLSRGLEKPFIKQYAACIREEIARILTQRCSSHEHLIVITDEYQEGHAALLLMEETAKLPSRFFDVKTPDGICCMADSHSSDQACFASDVIARAFPSDKSKLWFIQQEIRAVRLHQMSVMLNKLTRGNFDLDIWLARKWQKMVKPPVKAG